MKKTISTLITAIMLLLTGAAIAQGKPALPITEQPEGTLVGYLRSGEALGPEEEGKILFDGYDFYLKPMEQTGSISIVTNGSNVYFLDLAFQAGFDSWVQGTLSADNTKITVPLGQSIYHYDGVSAEDSSDIVLVWGTTSVTQIQQDYELSFTQDPTVTEITFSINNGVISMDNGVGNMNADYPYNYVATGLALMDNSTNEWLGNLEWETIFSLPTPAVPANPNSLDWDPDLSQFYFTLPLKDVDGNEIQPNYLSYNIFFDDDTEPFIFLADDYDLDSDMSEIPFTFGNDNFYYGGGIYFNQATTLFNTRIGVRANYTVDGVTNHSDIVYWPYDYQPATPANPTYVDWLDYGSIDDFISSLTYDLPHDNAGHILDTDGNPMNSEYLSFSIFLDDETEPFEFSYSDGDGNQFLNTRIPYNTENDMFWPGFVGFNRTNNGNNPLFARRIGIQFYYSLVGTTTLSSDIVYYGPTSVEIDPDPIEVQIGQAVQANAICSPNNNDIPYIFNWRVWEENPSPTSLATITDHEDKLSCAITGNRTGTAKLIVSTRDGVLADTVTLIVSPKAVESVEILYESDTLVLTNGESQSLGYNVTPDDVEDTSLTWSTVPEGIISVVQSDTAEQVIVTPLAMGTAQLIATSNQNPEVSDILIVTVEPIPVTFMDLYPQVQYIYVGDTTSFQTIVEPENATYPEVTWSAVDDNGGPTNVIDIDQDGTITGVEVGTAYVVATNTYDPSITASVPVEVMPIPVDSLVITPNISQMVLGDTLTFHVDVYPENATCGTLSWRVQSNNEAATITVDESGFVTATGLGTSTLWAECSDAPNSPASLEIEVVAPPVSGVTISPKSVELFPYEDQDFTATVQPENAENQEVSWSVIDPDGILDLTEDGTFSFVTAYGVGTAYVVVTTEEGGFTDTATVIVNPVIVEQIIPDSTVLNILVEEVRQLNYFIFPEGATYQDIEWSTADTGIINVEPEWAENGIGAISITGLAVGTETLTLNSKEYPEVTATVTVNVQPIPVTFMDLYPQVQYIYVGDTTSFQTIVEPENATYPEVTWSVMDSTGVVTNVISIDQDGTITGVEVGTAYVVATNIYDPSITASAPVEVLPIPVDSLVITPNISQMVLGDTLTFHVDVYPENATCGTLNWSVQSNNEAATITVDESGFVTATGLGTSTLWAECSDAPNSPASLEIEVVAPPVSGVTISPKSVELFPYENQDFTATVQPEIAENQEVYWSVIDPDGILDLTEDGTFSFVTAYGVGTAYVVVTTEEGGFTDTATVIVNPVIVEEIILDSTVMDIMVEDVREMNYFIFPENATYQDIDWSTADTGIINVEPGWAENGIGAIIITGLAVGTETLTLYCVEYPEITATVTVNVQPIPVTFMDLYPQVQYIYVGDTTSFQTIVEPENATYPEVTWSAVDDNGGPTNVIDIDQDGTITGVEVGTAYVVATNTYDPSITASVPVEVMPIPVDSLVITPNISQMVLGDTLTFHVDVYPENATCGTLNWSVSSTQSPALSIENGFVTAIDLGVSTIWVECSDAPNSPASLEIEVIAPPVSGVTISPKSVELFPYEDQVFTATVQPEIADNQEVSWSVIDPDGILDLTEDGSSSFVTAYGVGTAYVVVTTDDGGFTDTATVIVNPIIVEQIIPDSTVLNIMVEEVRQLNYFIFPEDATYQDIEWSTADTGIINVEPEWAENGIGAISITGLAVGTETLTLNSKEYPEVTATVTVNVHPIPVESLTLTPMAQNVVLGTTFTYTATAAPANATYQEVEWSVDDPTIVSVENGVVTGLAIGSTTITATCVNYPNISATSTVTVIPVDAETLTISPTAQDITLGETFTFTATMTPDNVTYPEVEWSVSDSLVISVEDGVVTALGVGTATVTVTYVAFPDLNASATVNVLPVPVTDVFINPITQDITLGETFTFTATVTPDNATYPEVEWSVGDPDIINIEEGTVTALAVGTTTVVVTSVENPQLTASATVNVLPIPVESITIDPTAQDITIGETYPFIAIVAPDNATFPEVEWSVSDSLVISVEEGIVSALAVGTATLTVTSIEYPEITASATVNVLPIPVESITIDPTAQDITIGETYTFTATVAPDNATYPEVEWSVSDPNIISVENGVVTALGVGTATVTVTSVEYPDIIASATVNVLPIPVESITIAPTTQDITIGETYTFTATVAPDNATYPEVEWSVSDSLIISVDNGIVTALGVGTATVTVTSVEYPEITASATVNVLPVPVTDVFINPIAQDITLGETFTFTATVTPDNATYPEVEWSVGDPNIISVEEGTVTALAVGTTTVVVTSVENPQLTASATVNVLPILAESVTINIESDELQLGETTTLTVTVLPENTTNPVPTWSVQPEGIITIDQNGNVTAIAEGTATVTATVDEVSDNVTITVVPVPAESVTINIESNELQLGETTTLTVTVLPENTTYPDPTWSVQPEGIVTIDQNGNVTAIAEGTATVTATVDEVSDNATITVVPVPAESVTINIESNELQLGETTTLTVTVLPTNTTYPDPTWSVQPEGIVTIDQNGNVTAIAEGTATVTATVGEVSDNVTITVVPVPAESVTINIESNELQVGETTTFTVTVIPENTTYPQPTWSVQPEGIVTIDQNGNVTAIAEGTVTVTATVGEVSATATITVVPVPAESVTINIESTELQLGETTTFTVTVMPENTTYPEPTWSVQPEGIITIDQNGNVTAIAEGTATVTATVGEVSATATITVVPVPAESVTINIESTELQLGETTTFTVTVTPENTTYPEPTWSVQPEGIITIDQNGNVTAIAEGTATVTATVGEVSATATITVVPVPAESVTINIESSEMQLGETMTFTVTVTPENTTYPDPVWSVQPAGIVTIDENGNVTAIAEGTATVTATVGDVSASVVITVVPVPAESVTINIEASELELGESMTFTVTVLPTNTTHPEVTWSVNPEGIVTVSERGTITAIGLGTATVTATVGDVNGSVTITVVPVAAQSITLTPDGGSILVGETIAFTAQVNPSNTTYQNVVWSVSNSDIISVDANGVVTALAAGMAQVIATVEGTSVTAAGTIIVSEPYTPVLVESITITPESVNLTVGETYNGFVVTVLPENAENPNVVWSVSDDEVISVDANGVVTALAAGTAIVTVASEENPDITASATVTVANAYPDGVAYAFYFETDPIAAGWQFVDHDGDGNNWNWIFGEEGVAVYEGQGIISSASYINGVGALNPDNWAITPAITLPEGDITASLYARGQDPNYAAEHFQMYVGTSPDINTMTEISSEYIATDDYQQYLGILNEYQGQTVYIAIRHYNVTDEYQLNIDQFEVFYGPVSVAEDHTMVVYPNPTNGNVKIEVEGMTHVTVVNMLGQVVYEKALEGNETTVDMSQFELGLYFVRVNTTNGVMTRRVIVTR